MKKEKEWENAKIEKIKSIDEYTWFKEHYFALIQHLRPFNSMGEPRDKAIASIKIKEALEALSLLDSPKLNQQIKYIHNILDNGQLLHYMDEVLVLHQQLQSSLNQETSWLWMLYWQWDKKSCQTHSPKVQKRAKQEADTAKELLEAYYGQSIDLEGLSVFEGYFSKVLNFRVFSSGCFSCRNCEHSTAAKAAATNIYNTKRVAFLKVQKRRSLPF